MSLLQLNAEESFNFYIRIIKTDIKVSINLKYELCEFYEQVIAVKPSEVWQILKNGYLPEQMCYNKTFVCSKVHEILLVYDRIEQKDKFVLQLSKKLSVLFNVKGRTKPITPQLLMKRAKCSRNLAMEYIAAQRYLMDFNDFEIKKCNGLKNPAIPFLSGSSDGLIAANGKIERLFEVSFD